jgi:hypothetical protein
MDNQSSPEAKAAANKLPLKWELVNPNQKEPNRAERAIRTAKNHIIANDRDSTEIVRTPI